MDAGGRDGQKAIGGTQSEHCFLRTKNLVLLDRDGEHNRAIKGLLWSLCLFALK